MKFRDAIKLLLPYKGRLVIIMLLSVIIAVTSAVTPFVSQMMIDNGILQQKVDVVVKLVLAIIALQVGGYVIEYIQRVQEINIVNSLGKRLKTQAFEHGLKLKPSYYKDRGFFKTISDAVYDISCIMSIASNSFFTILVIICKCLGAAIGLFVLDWRLALFIVAIIPVKYAVNAYMRKRAEKLGKDLMDVNKNFNTWYSNVIQGLNDIKLLNLEKQSIDVYAGHTEKINTASKKQNLMSEKNSLITNSIETVLSNFLYIIGAVLISGGSLTFGGLVAFITFATYTLLPVNIIFNLRIILKQISPNVESLKHYNSLEEENYDSKLLMDDEINTIEFDKVTVRFDGREVLKNVSAVIHKGEKVAIIGENGSGKTTLMNLLLRFCEPSEGAVFVNGRKSEDYNVVSYRESFSVVSQNIHLFKGTIDDNISFGADCCSMPENDKLSFCTDVVDKLAGESDVGAEGMKLSGGERQKIALLRACRRRAKIMIMDEPTSSYDGDSRQRFNEYLKNDKSCDFHFVVTHDREVLDSVDRVFKIDGGVLTELYVV